MPKSRSRVTHTMGSENVYADLGYAAADDMLVRARLVTKIAQILSERGLTQMEAAKIVGVPQPKLSRLLRGQFRGFSERKLIDCLTELGSDVSIVVVDPGNSRAKGSLSVVFAERGRARSRTVVGLRGSIYRSDDPARRRGFSRVR